MRLSQARQFRGRFALPGDKSLSHRLAIMGALAHGQSRFENFSTADDCAATLRCLQALGVEARHEGRTVEVVGRGPESLKAAAGPLEQVQYRYRYPRRSERHNGR